MPDKPEQVAVVAIGPGNPPPANTILTTSYDTVFASLPDTRVRADQIRRLDSARADALVAHNEQRANTALMAKAFADAVARLNHRLDVFQQRRAERARVDAEREQQQEQQRIAAQLAALPDPDSADPLGSGFDFPKPADEDPHQFATGPAHGAAPGAGLEDAALPGDPSPPAGGRHALSADKQAAFFGAPVVRDQTEFPDPDISHPPEFQQPTAVGLDRKF